MNRRHFLTQNLSLASGFMLAQRGAAQSEPVLDGLIMTVTGPIEPKDLGRTLIHEHVIVDFIGADKTSPKRYDPEQVFNTVLPHLLKLKQHEIKTLVECTPRYIGRNASLLRRLSLASGLNIISNTGWYAAVNHKFLPPEAFTESADAIAERWLDEWRKGLRDESDADTVLIQPGFLKLGTGKGVLPEVDAKLLRAAAKVHRQTGLTIAVHTGDGVAALDEIRLLKDEGVAADALIWVHAMNGEESTQIEAAKLGAWISLDGYSPSLKNRRRFVNFVLAHRQAGTLNRVLLSQDDGWAVDGEAPSGNGIKLYKSEPPPPYETLFTHLLPDLRQQGLTEPEIDQILSTNPSNALTIRRRLIA